MPIQVTSPTQVRLTGNKTPRGTAGKKWQNNWTNSESKQLPPLSARVPSSAAKGTRETLSVWAETVGLWDETLCRVPTEDRLIFQQRAPVSSVCIIQDDSGPCVLVGSHDNTCAAIMGDDAAIMIDDVSTDEHERPVPLQKGCTFVVSSDSPGTCWTAGWHGNVRKWSIMPGHVQLQHTAPSNSGSFCAVLCSSKESFLLGSWGCFQERCCETGALLREYCATEQPLVYVSALATHGEHIVSCLSDGCWQLWRPGVSRTAQSVLGTDRWADICSNGRLNQPSQTLYHAAEPLWCTAIAGSIAFAGCRNGAIYSVEILTENGCTESAAQASGTIGSALGWTEDDGNIDVMEGHRGAVQAMRVVGEQLVSGSSDCTVRLWWIDSKICTRVFCGHSNDVVALCIRQSASQGLQVLSGAHDGLVLSWEISHQCPYKCGVVLPLATRAAEEELKHHAECLCVKRPVKCPNLCSIGEVAAADLVQHLAEECELRAVECPLGCGARAILAVGLRAHMETLCEKRHVQCVNCNA